MGLKNISVLEQHVEKVILGAAAAGALVLVYLAVQTVGFTDENSTKDPRPHIGPNDVERAISEELDALDRQRQDLIAKGRPNPRIDDYAGRYRRLSGEQPLDAALLAAAPPPFGPRNLRAGPSTGGGEVLPTTLCVVPEPPAPELLHAQLLSVAVADKTVDATGAPVPPPAGNVWATQTRNVVVIDGWVPVGQMVLQMLNETDPKKRFTADVLRGIVYRVRVQRQDMTGGRRSGWEDIAPAKGAPAPSDILNTTMPEGELPARIADIDSQFQWIQLPPYYVDAQGQPFQPPILSQPVPESIAAETAKLHNEIETARANIATPGMVRPVLVPPAPGAAQALPNTMEAIRALDVQPFTFWDDSVKPDHSYQYRVQIQCVNPAFGWRWTLAPNQTVSKLDPTIPLKDNGFRIVPGPAITVHSDIAFFIMGTGMGNNGLSIRLFYQRNGRWYNASPTVHRGMNIEAPMNIDGQTQDVDTKFAVVDYQDNGPNVHVILQDPSGNLITRDSAQDSQNKEKDDLMDKVRQGNAATSAAPGDATTITPLTPSRGATPAPTVTPIPTTPTTPGRTPVRVNP